jgi:uridylate kinase
MDEKIVISLGGSLIIPEEIDIEFLSRFREIILGYVAQGKKFFIITGGGKICRKYQEAAKKIVPLSKDDLDWLGIHATRFNAEFLRLLFGEYANENIISDSFAEHDFKKPILIGSGWNPGHSTDYGAVLASIKMDGKKVINLSNIDYVYDSDPKKNPDAKKFERISWEKYLTFIPKEWDPGLSTPFDPVASREAEKEGVEVAIINGADLSELSNYIDGLPFKGTIITND